ncbi:diacylglycerol/lipid kinase family protein [Flammeovirga kamogawensis]|uniref:Diacylglycerol kinase n=1 Tax=Flammeovirga kamogawensis TaxID=373891 RepID=A0ABX8GVM7_9BACT|nr:diacylglycerol kinase family protein [Flammeovirga kamogawensis]MBB6459665.1 diacylglycerol kinase family enzyme [Flammeovirga kamogawensis]QWG07272.1 diacylglycerol kinase [Flammeovirga kamogawensis]TRX69092.1 diacylglycerol kinase [Flammeovirga kamogawensis]
MKLLLVVNPISGDIDKEPFLNDAENLLNLYEIEFTVYKTTGKNDLEILRSYINTVKPHKVASIGGDGTTLFTSIALLGTGIPMGIIPLGSANGMAVELFVDPDPMNALKDIIMSDMTRGLDLLQVNKEHYCLHIGDIGVNAQIVNGYSNDPNRGMTTYFKYFLEQLKVKNIIDYKIEIDGEFYQESGIMLAICNARKFGTGVPLNSISNPFDGKFELVAIPEMNFEDLIIVGLSKFDESFLEDANGNVYSAEKATIHFEKTQLLQLDGEVIGDIDTLEIEVLPAAIKYITTKRNTLVS